MTEHKTLAAAKCAVMAQVGWVKKTGENKFHRYKYASEADLNAALQTAMSEHGLAMAPTKCGLSRNEGPKTRKGVAQWLTEGVMTYTLLHTSGVSETIEVWGSGIDGEDKGAYKAMTGALKYALRQAFLIPTGDDPDADRREDH